MRFVVIAATLGAADAANADSLTMAAGVGVAWTELRSAMFDAKEASFTSGAALRLDVMEPVHPNLMVGVHGGWAHATGIAHAYEQGEYDFSYNPLELGVTAQLTIDRVWIAPWLGISKLLSSDLEEAGDASFGYGLAAGCSIYSWRNEGPRVHYVDVFASVTRSTKANPDYILDEPNREPYLGFAVGLDVRY
jgi:hypothetical protein